MKRAFKTEGVSGVDPGQFAVGSLQLAVFVAHKRTIFHANIPAAKLQAKRGATDNKLPTADCQLPTKPKLFSGSKKWNRNYFKRSAVACILLLCLVLPAKAQHPLLDSLSLDTIKAYTDLQEAIKNPDDVVKLVLRKEKLKTFPLEILQFKNLQYLDLSKNSFTELPDTIRELKNLQVLILSKNEIEYLPKTIGELSNLKTLNVNQNELVELPASVGRLKKLEYLDLWSNNLERFPDSMVDLKDNLKVLDLRVILLSDDIQQRLLHWLPKTKIHFSPNCKCKY